MLCRQVTDAEAEVTTKAEERAKVWKTGPSSNTTSSNTTPNTSVEIVPKDASASSSKTEPNPWTHPAEPADGEFSFSTPVWTLWRTRCVHAEAAVVKPQTQPSADDQYVAEQLKLMALSLEQDADRDQLEDSGSDTSSSDDDDGDEEGRGLEAFEDVLSSWLTAVHSKTSRPFVKAQASLPLKPRSGGGGGGGGGQSTLARIQEQQQQLTKDEEEEAGSSGLAASHAKQEAAGAKDTQPSQQTPAAGRGAPEVAEDEEEDEPESPTGIEGWKDVLSNWMTTAGVAAPAQQANSKASAGKAGTGAHQQAASKANSKAAVKAAEPPSWLADVSSDEEEEAGTGTEVSPPRTSSITEQQLKAAASRDLSSEADKASAAGFDSAQQAQHAQHAASSNASAAALLPPSPLQGYSVPVHLDSTGVSSQDPRLNADLLSRARSDPAALWNNSAPGFPPRSGQEPRLPPAVATSLPAPMYPADQGLPPQALQNWKEQFKGLYRSFGADQPAQQFVTVPNPAFAAQRLEPPPGFTANSHEFECTVTIMAHTALMLPCLCRQPLFQQCLYSTQCQGQASALRKRLQGYPDKSCLHASGSSTAQSVC